MVGSHENGCHQIFIVTLSDLPQRSYDPECDSDGWEECWQKKKNGANECWNQQKWKFDDHRRAARHLRQHAGRVALPACGSLSLRGRQQSQEAGMKVALSPPQGSRT
ncbi:hypothetical protein MC885_007803 [Smutsia gigantea]|nr:hypothetical protein MC885_007803 [Smutsia gigantea]